MRAFSPFDMMKKRTMRRLRGFTLMETLLAVALVAVLVSIFLTVFLPARGMVRQALTRQESERITGTLRAEMSTLRGDEIAPPQQKQSAIGKYLTPFDKSFFWMMRSKKPSTSVVIFSYRADTSKSPRADGSFPAVPPAKAIPGLNSQIVTIACPMDDATHRKDIKNAVGPVFLVRMTQLIPQGNGEFKLASSPGTIGEASSPGAFVSQVGDRDGWGGVVFFRADFFLMTPPDPARYRNKSWAKLGRPLFSANLSFRR